MIHWDHLMAKHLGRQKVKNWGLLMGHRMVRHSGFQMDLQKVRHSVIR